MQVMGVPTLLLSACVCVYVCIHAFMYVDINICIGASRYLCIHKADCA
jgi:hypothetical protein